MYIRIALFLVLNFGALAIGSRFTGAGVPSDWYQQLAKAPWTPPGWVFGAAWTTIMICFSIYMAFAWRTVENRNLLLGLYALQWVLNVLWNPVFFKYHHVLPALVVITALTILVIYFLLAYFDRLKAISILIVPYVLWLLVATSLNLYIYLKN